MKGYWSDTRPNGRPVEAGTFCWITDLEDGTAPVATYGKTQDEVLQKLAKQNANAQAALLQRTQAPAAPPARSVPASTPTRLSPDEKMRATADLQNPAKAADAIVSLFQDATGVDPRQAAALQFKDIAMDWMKGQPAFYPHPGNKDIVARRATQLAGGRIAQVTAQHLQTAFEQTRAEGLLFEAPPANQDDDPNPSLLPGESQVQRERPRGMRYATQSSSSSSARQPAQTRTLKYTEAQIRAMPAAKSRQLIESNDPDYAQACDFYFGAARAS
jgi:hypothetical protein